MAEAGYAPLGSQLGDEPCPCEDTEEMFWLRESDDYESRLKLGNLLSGRYRFREAVEAYRSAEKIRSDDPGLYVRLGGACLTLRRFGEAKEAYEKVRALGGSEKSVAYPMGVWHYLREEYREAAEAFARVLPCGDEMKIAILYWHALSCMRGNLPDGLLGTYREDMQVGHHTAYRTAVGVMLGRRDADETFRQAEADKNDLDAVIALYGISVCLACRGRTAEAGAVLDRLLERGSVWPCVSYLSAWNDRNNGDG